ncbi:MAG: DUF58 domain-containing protein [Proteobacteria bacterium]|nr:DUF58 domain-containing protein [Pseudomonadota bacterium]
MRRFHYTLLRLVSASDWFVREHLTGAGKLAAVSAFMAAVVGLDTHQSLASQVFALLAAMLALSAVLSLMFRAKVSVRRTLPRFATAGEELGYRISVGNTGTRPLADLEVRERFADARPTFDEFRRGRDPREAQRNWVDRKGGYFRWRHLVERRLPERCAGGSLALMPAGAHAEVRATLVPRRRGVLAFDGVDIVRPDVFGLAYGRAHTPLADKLVVLPRRYRVPQVLLPAQRLLQPGGHALASTIGDSEEFLSLREYRPGDSLRRVHWKSFARTGEPVVKEYETEFFERHALVLDTGAPGETEAFEEAVSIAASFVYTIDTQESLLDLVFVAGQPECHTAGRGEASNVHLLEILAGLAPTPPAEFDTLARQVLSMRGTLSSAVFVLLAWDEPRRKLVSALTAAGLGVRVLLVSETPPADAEGLLVLQPGRIEAGLMKLA